MNVQKILTMSLMLSTISFSVANASPALELRIDRNLERGQAPQLSPWPSGLPLAMQIINGRVWVYNDGGDVVERPIDAGVFLPQALALEIYSRLYTLDVYPRLAQAVIDESQRVLYSSLVADIEERDKYIASHSYTLADVARTSLIVGGIATLVGVVFGGLAF